LIVGIQQSSNDLANAERLYDYGFKRLFTPDRRGHNDLSSDGPIIVGPGPHMGDVIDFAIDHVTGNWSVSAAIDGEGHLQIVNWDAEVTPGTVVSLGGAIQTYSGLASGQQASIGTTVDVVQLPTNGTIVGDYLTGSIAGGNLRLDVWRLGAEPVEAFQYLPGDYNRDLRVDAADYIVYRDTLGSTTDLRADGNANQYIDLEDYDAWRANFGKVQSLPPIDDLILAKEATAASAVLLENRSTMGDRDDSPAASSGLAVWLGDDADETNIELARFLPAAISPRDQAFGDLADRWSEIERNFRPIVRTDVGRPQLAPVNLSPMSFDTMPYRRASAGNAMSTNHSETAEVGTSAFEEVFAELGELQSV
jgi:hypothetical protein